MKSIPAYRQSAVQKPRRRRHSRKITYVAVISTAGDDPSNLLIGV